MKLGTKCVDKATGLIKGFVVRFNGDQPIGRSADGKMFHARWQGGHAPKEKHRCSVTIIGYFAENMPGRWLTKRTAKIDQGAHPVFGGATVNIQDPDVRIEDAA